MRHSGPKVGSQDWFNQHQLALLFLANTRGGRKMLRIYDDCPRDRSIVRLRPNGFDCLDERHPTFLHALWSMRKPREVRIVADFRCRPKIANRLAHSWVPKALAWNRYVGEVWDRAGSPFRVRPAFAATLTAYPDPDVEVNSVDGRVRQTGTNLDWPTIIGGVGSQADDNDATDYPVVIGSGSSSSGWNTLTRVIVLFLTSSIGAGSTVTVCTLTLTGAGTKLDSLSITPSLNAYSSAPATNTALVAGDFDSIGGTAYSDTALTYAGWSNTGANVLTFNATGRAAVSLTDVTKLGTRNPEYDVAAVEPAWSASVSSYVGCAMAETAGTASDPTLVVTYTAATATGWRDLMMLGVG